MRDHDEIRSMLAALAGGDLSATDRMLVEQHLADCRSCRAELAQLQIVVQAIRAMPEEEPPPWLATRIMARVREESVSQRGWFARLFLPLRIKLPLEAFALVMICVTAWYVMQEVDRSQKVTPDAPQIKAPKVESVRDAIPQSAPVPSPVQTHPPGQPGTPPAQKPPAPVFASPPHVVTADQAEPMDRAKAASEAASAAPTASPEQAAGNAAPLAERKTAAKRKAENSDNRLGAAVPQPLRLRLAAHDREAFAGNLADLLQRLGGSVVTSRPGTALVRIDASRLAELLAQLAVLGRVTEQPVVDASRTGTVELQIFW